MTFSVGILYSVHQFLQLVGDNVIKADEFVSSTKFVLSDPGDILALSQNCNWIHVGLDGCIALTQQGTKILSAPSEVKKLRLQIRDLISFHRPPWSTRIMHGRDEALSAMPADVEQCFKECGLLDDWTDELIEWWQSASLDARVHNDERKSKTGFRAEQLTMDYETQRLGERPRWLSLDSAFAGYDVLSKLSVSEEEELLIEVKGSEQPPKQASFYFSHNAYRTAVQSPRYVLHLWCLSSTPQLFVVPFKELAEHLPVNQGDGRWESSRIPYSTFSAFKVA